MDEEWKRYLQIAASGALTGAGMGGIGKLLGGSRSLPAILGAAGTGAIAGGTAIPGAAYLGEQILGAPGEEDLQPYTARAGIGGALAGGAGGAGLGYLAGSGLSAKAGSVFPGVAKALKAELPIDNMLVDWIKRSGGKKGALLGALLGAGGLGYLAADEGQQLDTIRNASKSIQGDPNVSI